MWLFALVAVYSVLLCLASLLGGWLPSMIRMTHTRMQLSLSFVGGLMLGVAVLHLLPHGAVEAGSLNTAAIGTLCGLIVMFLMIRLFHVHAHGTADPMDSHHHHVHGHHECCDHEHGAEHDHVRDHDHDSSEQHHVAEEHAHSLPVSGQGEAFENEATVFDSADCHRHPLSWIGLAIGLSLHTLIDGMALAASVAVEKEHVGAVGFLGIGTFLAVLLHKPLDALSITSVMGVGGWTGRWKTLVNVGFSLICPIGFVVFLFGMQQQAAMHSPWLGFILAFAAGAFICIALSDLLPEVQFHSHDRVKLSLALLAGVAIAYGIGFLESEHQHHFDPASQHQHGEAGDSQGHDHDHSHDGHSHDGHVH
ncbi:MAG: ZIP family metal transporter [Planctomycetales bacterium]|nr:ZIP family metal transporter [Planctomycetales bacterium]